MDPACCGKCPGCKSKASLPPSIVLEAMQILEAEDAAAGFELLEKQSPDFVVCDQIMPGMSGTDFYKKMRAMAKFKETPFLILSGEDVVLPADNYARVLKKPVMPNQILEVVARWSPKRQAAS